MELLGESGFVPEERLAAVKKDTGELKGIFVSIVRNTKAKSKIRSCSLSFCQSHDHGISSTPTIHAHDFILLPLSLILL
jgi:hypothetical protein